MVDVAEPVVFIPVKLKMSYPRIVPATPAVPGALPDQRTVLVTPFNLTALHVLPVPAC